MTELVREYLENVIQRIVALMVSYGYELETDEDKVKKYTIVNHTSMPIRTYSSTGRPMGSFTYDIYVYDNNKFVLHMHHIGDYMRYDWRVLESTIKVFCNYLTVVNKNASEDIRLRTEGILSRYR